MIERVANAIHAELTKRGFILVGIDWIPVLGRAAIEAMREPTPAMVAATEAWCEADECDAQYLDTLGFVGVWEAMIDAALKETRDG
jgi:hypothetical protein